MGLNSRLPFSHLPIHGRSVKREAKYYKRWSKVKGKKIYQHALDKECNFYEQETEHHILRKNNAIYH